MPDEFNDLGHVLLGLIGLYTAGYLYYGAVACIS